MASTILKMFYPETFPNGIDFEIKHFYSTVTNKTLFRFYETVFLIYKLY